VTGAAAGHDWIVYVREGCHLCEQFLLELSLELGPAIEAVRIVDVDRDVDLAARFGLRVPVLEVRGTVICEGVCDAAGVRRALQV
jgi:Glutaredoxin-like domain (DUF836)